MTRDAYIDEPKMPGRTSSVASFAPKCDACRTPDGCATHVLFTCPTCKRTVRWRDGGDPELDCTDCWYDARACSPVRPAEHIAARRNNA